mmetsp:Transcript_56073/g.103775  ORF Transcript_56073/g.103775 Transcript_56073/m.103775 type:complete len:482 (+) Transcript_56073:70-1515(+)
MFVGGRPELQFWNDKRYQSYDSQVQAHFFHVLCSQERPDTLQLNDVYVLERFSRVEYGDCMQVNRQTNFKRHVRFKPPYILGQYLGQQPATIPHFQYWHDEWIDYARDALTELQCAAQCLPPPSFMMLYAAGKEFQILHMDRACLGDCSHPMIQRTAATGKERLLRAVRDVPAATNSNRSRAALSLAALFTVGRGATLRDEWRQMLIAAWSHQPRPAQVTLGPQVVVEDFASLEAGGAWLNMIGSGKEQLTLWLPPPSSGELNLPTDLEMDAAVDLGQCGHYLALGAGSGSCIICQDSLASQRSIELSCKHSYHEGCLRDWFKTKKICPQCQAAYGKIHGNQPDVGKMAWWIEDDSKNGKGGGSFLAIDFCFQTGVDKNGQRYEARKERAYLEVNTQGFVLLELFKVAFRRQVMFGLGMRHKNNSYAPTFNIHVKSSKQGGMARHGYPDNTYFGRCLGELSQNGVNISDLPYLFVGGESSQ